MTSHVPFDVAKFKRKGTLVENQAAAGAKLLGKPRDRDDQGREILTADEMQDKLWKHILALKKECGKLNDTAIRKEAELHKLEQRLVKEIEFEKQQADGMPDDFASTIAMGRPTQKLTGAEKFTTPVMEEHKNNAAVFAINRSDMASTARGRAMSPSSSRANLFPLSGSSIEADEGEDILDNAAARHYLRDKPLLEYLSRQTDQLRTALEVEQATSMTLKHVAARLTQEKKRMSMAVDARRGMLDHCVNEMDSADRDRKHALFSLESAREKKAEKEHNDEVAAAEREQSIAERRGTQELVAKELKDIKDEARRQRRERRAREKAEDERAASNKARASFAGKVTDTKREKEEETMGEILRLTGTSDPDKLLALYNSIDDRKETSEKNKARLESIIIKKRMQVEEYHASLENVKLGGVAPAVGLREADSLDNRIYAETARVEKCQAQINDVVQTYAGMMDGFQNLLRKVKRFITLHSDGRPGPGLTLSLSAIIKGEDDDDDDERRSMRSKLGRRSSTSVRRASTNAKVMDDYLGKLSTTMSADAKVDQELSIGTSVLALIDKYEDTMKFVLEPLGGMAAAEVGELAGDVSFAGGSGEGLMDFGPPCDEPVASARRLRRMYTEAPPSVISSRRGGRVSVSVLDGLASAAGGNGKGQYAESDDEAVAPLNRDEMKTSAKIRVTKAKRAAARREAQEPNY